MGWDCWCALSSRPRFRELAGQQDLYTFTVRMRLILTIWQHWLASDALGIITVAPLMIQSLGRPGSRHRGADSWEGVVALVALVILNGFVILCRRLLPGLSSRLRLLFPMLLWLAARCHPVFGSCGRLHQCTHNRSDDNIRHRFFRRRQLANLRTRFGRTSEHLGCVVLRVRACCAVR